LGQKDFPKTQNLEGNLQLSRCHSLPGVWWLLVGSVAEEFWHHSRCNRCRTATVFTARRGWFTLTHWLRCLLHLQQRHYV